MPTQNDGTHSSPEDAAKLAPVRKTQQMLAVERAHGGLDIRLVLKNLYENSGSQKAVADQLGVRQSTITIWPIRLRISFTQTPVALIDNVLVSDSGR